MTALVLATLLCMGLALAVVALVAVPARREGRDLLTARGEEVVGALRERSDQVRPRRSRGGTRLTPPGAHRVGVI